MFDIWHFYDTYLLTASLMMGVKSVAFVASLFTVGEESGFARAQKPLNIV